MHIEKPPLDGSGRGWPDPGPISNHELLENGDVKPGLRQEHDYRGVNLLVWRHLVEFYGGGPQIRRPIVDIYSSVTTASKPNELRAANHEVKPS